MKRIVFTLAILLMIGGITLWVSSQNTGEDTVSTPDSSEETLASNDATPTTNETKLDVLEIIRNPFDRTLQFFIKGGANMSFLTGNWTGYPTHERTSPGFGGKFELQGDFWYTIKDSPISIGASLGLGYSHRILSTNTADTLAGGDSNIGAVGGTTGTPYYGFDFNVFGDYLDAVAILKGAFEITKGIFLTGGVGFGTQYILSSNVQSNAWTYLNAVNSTTYPDPNFVVEFASQQSMLSNSLVVDFGSEFQFPEIGWFAGFIVNLRVNIGIGDHYIRQDQAAPVFGYDGTTPLTPTGQGPAAFGFNTASRFSTELTVGWRIGLPTFPTQTSTTTTFQDIVMYISLPNEAAQIPDGDLKPKVELKNISPAVKSATIVIKDPVRGIEIRIPVDESNGYSYDWSWDDIKGKFGCEPGQQDEECQIVPFFDLDVSVEVELKTGEKMTITETEGGEKGEIVVQSIWEPKGSGHQMTVYNLEFDQGSCNKLSATGEEVLKKIKEQIDFNACSMVLVSVTSWQCGTEAVPADERTCMQSKANAIAQLIKSDPSLKGKVANVLGSISIPECSERAQEIWKNSPKTNHVRFTVQPTPNCN